MRRGLFVFVVLVAVGVLAGGASAGGGDSDAAHACQQNGYLNLHRSDGSSFKNTGDCVSYFAHGGTAGCTVTATSGCLVFDNVVLLGEYSVLGWTVTLNAAYSFSTACNSADQTSVCQYPNWHLPNDYAIGGGTYVIKDSSGQVVEQGTITSAGTSGSGYGGLNWGTYTSDTFGTASCSDAAHRSVSVVSDTNVPGDPVVELDGTTGDPLGTIGGFSSGWGGLFNSFGTTGITIAC